MIIKTSGGHGHETCKNFKYADITEYNEKRRMWRMPDILPVSM